MRCVNVIIVAHVRQLLVLVVDHSGDGRFRHVRRDDLDRQVLDVAPVRTLRLLRMYSVEQVLELAAQVHQLVILDVVDGDQDDAHVVPLEKCEILSTIMPSIELGWNGKCRYVSRGEFDVLELDVIAMHALHFADGVRRIAPCTINYVGAEYNDLSVEFRLSVVFRGALELVDI